jgi:type VI secretion system secreted protein Hcp
MRLGRFLTASLLSVMPVLLLPGVARAFDVIVHIEGRIQGPIEGPNTVEGREGSISVLAFGHAVSVPRDPTSGQASGRRVHHPITFTKSFDKATPELYQALATGESLIRVEFKFFRVDGTGAPEHYFTILLEDALIVGISSAGTIDSEQPSEMVTVIYSKITWTQETSGVETSDDWSKPTS